MTFAPEDQLLIQCSRVHMNKEAVARASVLLQQPLDWSYILEVSIRHGVSPLLFLGLQQVGRVVDLDAVVPAHVHEELYNLYCGNQARNRRLYRTIAEIFAAFDRAGIPAVGLKDMQLAHEVYPDVGMRPMGDLDILIHRHDYERVAACMTGLGFVPKPGPDIPFTLKYAWAHHFHRPSDNVWVDMQWNVMQREWDIAQEGNFDFEIARVWRGARLMRVGDQPVLVPNPEDMLFHLCLHLEGHAYCELILFCDIAELLRHDESRLDWEYLIALARQYRAESSLYYVLFLVERLFEAPVPAHVLDALAPPYFNANMFEPMFGNLTELHVSLDQIRTAVAPPAEVMRQFETAARYQAFGAMQMYRQFDRVASTFIGAGGALVIFDGTSSQKVFPDAALRPFEELRCLILEHDLERMRGALRECGFEIVEAASAYHQAWEARSDDPALAGPARLAIGGTIQQTLEVVLGAEENRSTAKKQAALRMLSARLRGRPADPARLVLRCTIAALTPEELLVYLSARLGKRKTDRLFGICSLLDFFRRYTDPLDWTRVDVLGRQHNLTVAVGAGLALVRELLDDERLPSEFMAMQAARPQRVLEWARYDPETWGRYGVYRKPFFYLVSLLSTGGIQGRCRYLIRSLVGDWQSRPVLLRILTETAAGVAARWQRVPDTRSFAYWIEPIGQIQAKPMSDRSP